MKLKNLTKILDYINLLKKKRIDYPSVFSTVKRMLIFFVLYLIITGITAFVVIFSVNKNAKIVEVPDVINMRFIDAYKELHKLGLNVDIEERHYKKLEYGKVAHQSIEPGRKVKEHRKIKLIISLGPKSTTVVKSQKTSMESRAYVIKFKLPEMYNTARVKIIVSDQRHQGKVLFNDILSSTNKGVTIPVELYGEAKETIYINDDLFLEKEIK